MAAFGFHCESLEGEKEYVPVTYYCVMHYRKTQWVRTIAIVLYHAISWSGIGAGLSWTVLVLYVILTEVT